MKKNSFPLLLAVSQPGHGSQAACLEVGTPLTDVHEQRIGEIGRSHCSKLKPMEITLEKNSLPHGI